MTQDLERFTPDLTGLIAYEHRHRYALCANLVAGKLVLDVACGEGYGADILSASANRVVGVDIDAPTIERAREKYQGNPHLEFKVGDCGALPFGDAQFDVVVSFETIEHIAEQERFVAEVARVLRKGGAFIVSTPNRPVYSEESGLTNPFHVKELDEGEFRELLSAKFKHVQLFGQRFIAPSLIAPVPSPKNGAARSVGCIVARNSDADSRPRAGVAAFSHFQYFIAVCSNVPTRRKLEAPSLFVDESDDLWREHERILRWASNLHKEDEALRARLRASEEALERLRSEGTGSLSSETRGALFEVKELAASTRDIVQREIATTLARLAESQTAQQEESRLAQLQCADLRRSLDEAKAAFRQSEDRAALLSRELAESRSELNLAREASKEAAQAGEGARAKWRQSEERAAELSKDFATAKAQLQRSEASANEAAHAFQDAQRALHQSEQRVAELSLQFAEATEKSARIEHESAHLAAQLEEMQAEHQRAEARAEKLEHSLQEAREESKSAVAALGDAQATKRELEGALAAWRGEFETMEAAASELTDDLAENEAELQRKSDLLEKYVSAAAAQRAVFQRLERQVRVISVKRTIETQFANAAQTARTRLGQAPLGIVVHQSRLRSAIARAGEERPLGRAERNEIERSGLFDPEWYLEQNPDVAQHRIDPLAHYLRNGYMEDRDPHPLFNASWYRALYRDELRGTTPLIHFLRNGKSLRRSPHPLFDAKFYVSRYKDVAEHHFDPLLHFVQFGENEQRDPHPLVWMDRLSRHPSFAGVKRPFTAYLGRAQHFLASPHPLFDSEYYLYEYKDVRRQNICPLLHYCAIGWREGRQPNRVFPGDWYLAQNPDVLAAQLNPLLHFVQSGAFEDRSPHPLFDLPFYLRRNRDARVASYDALSHYLMTGAVERRETSERLSVDDMKSIVPDAYWRRFDALSAFIYFGETRISVPTQPRETDIDVNRPLAVAWPPTPEVAYWLPQQLRDFIIERYSEESIPLYLYLMSAVDRYGDSPDAFEASADLSIMKERLRTHCARRRRRKAIDVSVIIPVYNNLVFTLTCVLSLLENASRYNFEIIIADDRSSDGTEAVFSTAGGPIVHVRHEKNLGFLGNCNTAAKSAKGQYVVFLNNDTLILPGWLDELIAPFEADPRIGLTGSKLLNADGSLQEAGGIFWNDGSAWNFGRNNDPRLPEFNYAKDVDYISGASIALPTRVWNDLGGFDPIYTPAYCEDSDIAFRVREAGMRTLYAPQSQLVHHEGKSHGRDTGSGIKAYQIANQEKLLARWRGVLEKGHFANAEHVFLARDRSRGRPHVLVIDHYIPQWDRDAGSRTMYHFLRMFLDAGFKVTLWPDNLNEDREYCAPLQKAGVEVIYSAAYLDRFDEYMAANGEYFDYALVSRPHIAIKYYDALRAHSRCAILYYGHDIHYKRMELELETSHDSELIEKIKETRDQEIDNWRKADVVLYPSDDEREEVRRVLQDCVAASVPMLGYLANELSVARENLKLFKSRDFDELVFVGGSHPPNVDALRWFAGEVMPLVRAKNPRARLNVVGSTTNADIARLESESVVLRGRLSDAELAQLYATAGVAVVPLRFGGGVKGKTIEALFHAIPFVTTSVGMQGLFPEEPIGNVADSPEEFAQAVVSAQTEHAATHANVERGVSFIEAHYSLDALKRAFSPFVRQLETADKNVDAASASTPPVSRATAAQASSHLGG